MHCWEGLFPYLILDGERADLPSLSALALRRRQAGVVDSLVVAHIASRQRYQSSVYALLPLLCVLLSLRAYRVRVTSKRRCQGHPGLGYANIQNATIYVRLTTATLDAQHKRGKSFARHRVVSCMRHRLHVALGSSSWAICLPPTHLPLQRLPQIRLKFFPPHAEVSPIRLCVYALRLSHVERHQLYALWV